MINVSPVPAEERVREPLLAMAGSLSIEAIRTLFFASPFLLSLLQLLRS